MGEFSQRPRSVRVELRGVQELAALLQERSVLVNIVAEPGALVDVELALPTGPSVTVRGRAERVVATGVVVTVLLNEQDRVALAIAGSSLRAVGTERLPQPEETNVRVARSLAAGAGKSVAERDRSYARYLNLVARLCSQDQLEAACAVLEAAIARESEQATLKVQLCIVRARLAMERGPRDAVLEHLRAALVLEPSCEWAVQQLRRYE